MTDRSKADEEARKAVVETLKSEHGTIESPREDSDMIKQPITVAELIERLQSFDPQAVVMLLCEDHYYSGPLAADDIQKDEAILEPPAMIDIKDEGEIVPKMRQYPGGWRSKEELLDEVEESLDRKPCVNILVQT